MGSSPVDALARGSWQGGYCKVEKTVQQKCQCQSHDAVAESQQETGGSDKERISHPSAAFFARQQKRCGQRQAEKPGGAEMNQPRRSDKNAGKVIDLPVPEICPCRCQESCKE